MVKYYNTGDSRASPGATFLIFLSSLPQGVFLINFTPALRVRIIGITVKLVVNSLQKVYTRCVDGTVEIAPTA